MPLVRVLSAPAPSTPAAAETHLRPYIPQATRVSHWKPSQSCLFNFMHSGLKAQGPNQYCYSAKIFKVLSHCCGENLNQEPLKASSKPLLNKVPGVEWTRCSLSFCMCMNTSCYSRLLDVDVWGPTTRLDSCFLELALQAVTAVILLAGGRD